MTNSCYGICKSNKHVTWYDAKNYCIKLKGYLASIYGVEENIFIGGVSEQEYQVMSVGQDDIYIGNKSNVLNEDGALFFNTLHSV